MRPVSAILMNCVAVGETEASEILESLETEAQNKTKIAAMDISAIHFESPQF